jgi:hypothetical protein
MPHYFIEAGPQGCEVTTEIKWCLTQRGIEIGSLLLAHPLSPTIA